MKLFVVIPAYNEEGTISQVIKEVRKYTENVIVIDDGSKDRTAQLAKKQKAIVYCHLINRGLGGALATGIEVALKKKADIILTFDADGQHQAEDIPRLVKPIIESEADIVIGSRFLEKNKIPFNRKIANFIGNIITFILFGLWVSDSQSGLRCFNKKAAKTLKIETSSMEVSSEIIKEIKRHHLRLKEIPVKAIYTDYSLSKGQNFILGMKTMIKLIFLKFRSK
jgi:glycosyltransferase involved in cell wall biosynthesis